MVLSFHLARWLTHEQGGQGIYELLVGPVCHLQDPEQTRGRARGAHSRYEAVGKAPCPLLGHLAQALSVIPVTQASHPHNDIACLSRVGAGWTSINSCLADSMALSASIVPGPSPARSGRSFRMRRTGSPSLADELLELLPGGGQLPGGQSRRRELRLPCLQRVVTESDEVGFRDFVLGTGGEDAGGSSRRYFSRSSPNSSTLTRETIRLAAEALDDGGAGCPTRRPRSFIKDRALGKALNPAASRIGSRPLRTP